MNPLPCQHEELVSLTFEIVDFGDTFALQVCRKCLLSTVGKTEEQAAEAWNTRAGWISVDERLPEVGVYWGHTDDGETGEVLFTIAGDWCWYWDGDGLHTAEIAGEVTHWRPLPAPPESE